MRGRLDGRDALVMCEPAAIEPVRRQWQSLLEALASE